MSDLRYLESFRDPDLGRALLVSLGILARSLPRTPVQIMEFCGGHTHAFHRFGLLELLPPEIRMVHGPGCPVCVLPKGRIDAAIDLSLEKGAVLATYGDVLRVPGSHAMTLMKARSRGAEIKTVVSAMEALALAETHPDREIVFFAIGFETTTPPTAAVILEALRRGLRNFSVFANHVLTPSAMEAILSGTSLDGIIGPSHVSTVIGTRPYDFVARIHKIPLVVAGFEPLDILLALRMLLTQIAEGRSEVENEYARAVAPQGNPRSLEMISRVFERAPTFEWRGLGLLPQSGLAIREEFGFFDAQRRFSIEVGHVSDPGICECGEILKGVKGPRDCRIFGTICTPDTPVGACMVSAEGACAAVFHYGDRDGAVS